MASAGEQVEPTPDSVTLFEQLDMYSWSTDEEFKSGLSAILGPNPTPEQAAELTLRARCFYFARKFGKNVDLETYKEWKALNAAIRDDKVNGYVTSGQIISNEPEPSLKFSYQEIVDMIQNGKPIPGIKNIPSTVLAGQGTTAAKSTRRKPWEKGATAAKSTPSAEATAEAIAEATAEAA